MKQIIIVCIVALAALAAVIGSSYRLDTLRRGVIAHQQTMSFFKDRLADYRAIEAGVATAIAENRALQGREAHDEYAALNLSRSVNEITLAFLASERYSSLEPALKNILSPLSQDSAAMASAVETIHALGAEQPARLRVYTDRLRPSLRSLGEISKDVIGSAAQNFAAQNRHLGRAERRLRGISTIAALVVLTTAGSAAFSAIRNKVG